MKRWMCAVSVLLLSTGLAWGQSSKEELFQLKVVFGDKVSDFRVEKEGGVYFASYESNQSPERGRVIPRSEVDFIITRLQSIQSQREPASSCSRKWVSASARVKNGKVYQASGCLGGNAPTSKGLTQLANLLATQF